MRFVVEQQYLISIKGVNLIIEIQNSVLPTYIIKEVFQESQIDMENKHKRMIARTCKAN